MLAFAGIFALGVGAQWFAHLTRRPAILMLLAAGLLAGPVFGLLNPDDLFGDFLLPFVSLAVAVILFEGGLSLRLSDLGDPEVRNSVTSMVLLGSLVTLTLVSLSAYWVLGFEPELAILLGAILVVTGPTVIVPLLRQLRLRGRVGPILRWEGMMNDPLGAILALLVFEGILTGDLLQARTIAVAGMVRALVVGALGAILFARALRVALVRFWMPDHLRAPVALMMALTLFGLCDLFQAESGLVAVTLMGVLLANDEKVEVGSILEFKETLSVLLISVLFILLSARVTRESLLSYSGQSLIFVAVVVLAIRPLAVLLSTVRTGLDYRDKLLLSVLGPRGIVAAAVSSVFALRLEAEGFPRAAELMTMTFLVIAVTVACAGLAGPIVARFFGLSEDQVDGLLLVGAHLPAREIASQVASRGSRVLMVDTNPANVATARLAGLEAVRGNVLTRDLRERLDMRGIGHVLALTPNDEVNTLVAAIYEREFERSRVFRLTGTLNGPGRALHQELSFRRLDELWKEGWRPFWSAWPEGAAKGAVALVYRDDDGRMHWLGPELTSNLKEGTEVLALAPPQPDPVIQPERIDYTPRLVAAGNGEKN